MLSVLLIWAYIALTSGIAGYAAVRLLTWLCARGAIGGSAVRAYLPRTGVTYLLAGLVATTVYAEIFSLFSGVGATANAILIILCAVVAFILRRELKTEISAFFGRVLKLFRTRPFIAVMCAAAVIVIAAGTSAGIWHTDTPLYHAQAIHWIESFGAVKGLGNLQTHFAYNNACFSLYALYSMSFLSGRSFHAVQGFLALLLLLLVINPGGIGKGGLKTAFVRAAAAFQIFLLYDELVSPSSDAFVLLLVHTVIVLWTMLLDEREASAVPYAMIVMLAVYAVTVKLAAAPLLLLALKPVAMLTAGKGKRPRLAALFTALAVGITLPFFIRNIILSGWLLYPVLPQHIVPLSWQVPDGVGIFESREIRSNGRMIFDMELADVPLSEWYGAWLIRQPRAVRVMIRVAFASGILLVIYALAIVFARIAALLNSKSGRKPPAALPILTAGAPDAAFTGAVLEACVAFWFFTTPQIRFGESYLLLITSFAAGTAISMICAAAPDGIRKVLHARSGAAVCLVTAALGAVLLFQGKLRADAPVLQQDYDRYPVRAYEIDGLTFYCPTDFVYTGYYDFPATRWQMDDVHALGKSAGDGFYTR